MPGYNADVTERRVEPILKQGPKPKKPYKGLKRSGRIRAKPVTDEVLDERDRRAECRRAVIARDRECVILRLDPAHRERCTGGSDVHEIKKRSAGGSPFDPDNCLLLCNWGNVHAVEGAPDYAHALGLVCRHGDTLEDCRLRREAAARGDVDLTGIRCPT